VRAGLVFLHGSGPADAAHWSAWAMALAERGVASLSYDKPGVGASEGDWMTQSFAERASEALAAVRFLGADSRVGGVPIGLLGMSQGAWIGPHAASMSEHVGFVVALSGSATGPRDQDRFRVGHELTRDGFAPDLVAAALAAWDECDALFRSGADDQALEAAVARYRDEPWIPYFVLADPHLFAYGRLIWHYDPLPFLERCRSPLLAIWGSADALVDAGSSAATFEQALTEAGNANARLVTIHGADHGLRTGGERPAELLSWIADWILENA
jgi:pimeloyl-ACP methyl ester carboxylesterase